MARRARNPEIVIVHNPLPDHFLRRGYAMKHRKRRKSKGRRKGKCVGAYARFTKSQWRSHHAKYHRMGVKRAAKAIGALWRRKHPKKHRRSKSKRYGFYPV